MNNHRAPTNLVLRRRVALHADRRRRRRCSTSLLVLDDHVVRRQLLKEAHDVHQDGLLVRILREHI